MIAAGLTLRQLALFWQKVDKNGPLVRPDLGRCWVWTGAVIKKLGYGEVNHSRKVRLVHRVAYEIAYGPIPRGRKIDHRCRTKTCLRPTHLRPVTQKQNSENLSSIGRGRSGIRGVKWDSARQKWSAGLTHHYRSISLGRYDTKEEAAVVVLAARRKYFTHNDTDQIGA